MDKIFSKAFEVPVVYTATGTGMPSGGARFGGAMANGGDLLVNRPTWFLAGEDGPERATFTPVGRPSSGSGGSTGPIHITVVSQLDGREVEVQQNSAKVEEICRAMGARSMTIASDAAERLTLWKGRKAAFAAMGKLSPNYYVQDGVNQLLILEP